MIAVDSSVVIAFINGESGRNEVPAKLEQLDRSLAQGEVSLPPVVLSEVLCAKGLTSQFEQALLELPLLPEGPSYWERAGRTRAGLLRRGLKARLADTLIALSCIDNDVPLLTLDSDFRHFVRLAKLRLA